MALYPKSSRSLVDRDLLAKFDDTYKDKLLEADNVYIRKNGNLTRRPPIKKRSFNFQPGEILDAKSTKNHYVIVRRVEASSLNPASKVFGHVTFNKSQLAESYTIGPIARRTPLPTTEEETQLRAKFDRTADTYDFMPDSEMVAIDFYDKGTGGLNKDYSKLFAIHKPTTSNIPSGQTKESNRLVATASTKLTNLPGGDKEAVVIGVYSRYQEANDYIEDLKFIPPTVMGTLSSVVESSGVLLTLQDVFNSTGFVCYEQDYLYEILNAHYGIPTQTPSIRLRDYEFVSNSYENGTPDRISIYDDNVVFTFCGLGYVIQKNGSLRCIHSDTAILPTIKDVNQDTIRTYPLSKTVSKSLSLPIRIFFRKARSMGQGANKQTLIDQEEVFEGLTAFRNKYPEYSSIIERLSQTVSYVPLLLRAGYSNDTYYAMPDVKFLVPGTDISADCKFISKADTPYESAWFGVPCMRHAFMGRNAWMNAVDDKRFPYDNGISAGGAGCSAILFKRDQDAETYEVREGSPQDYIVPTLLNRALRHVFEGEPIVFPQEYIDYINGVTEPEDIEIDENQDPPENPPENNEERYGTIPAIAFSDIDQTEADEIKQGTVADLYEAVKRASLKVSEIIENRKKGKITGANSAASLATAREAEATARENFKKARYNDEGFIKIKETFEASDNMGQVDAYIHIEPNYQADEFRDFFDDKNLMCLPSSDGKKGYIFEILKKGGLTGRTGTAVDNDTGGPQSICSFEDGLGYTMPEGIEPGSTAINTYWLSHLTMYKRVNLLRNSPKTLKLFAGENGPKRPKLTSLVTEDKSPIPFRFSAAGVYFPTRKANLSFTNVRNMFFSGNELSVSASEDVEANIFYEPLKEYYKYIANQSRSQALFLDMGLYNEALQSEPQTEPNFFTTVTRTGQEDPILEIILLDERLVIHTESGLSTVDESFSVINRFAEVEINTNLVKDGTAIIGANANRVYVAGFSRELGGYTVDDINKELREIPNIHHIVDVFDAHRIALLLPERGNVMYVLTQEVDRRFKGFTRFVLPIEVTRAFRETPDSVLFIDKNSNVYSLNFNTNSETKYTDSYDDDDGNAVERNIISSIRATPLISVDRESSTFFTKQTVTRLGLGIHGVPKMELTFKSEGRDQCYDDKIGFVLPERCGSESEDDDDDEAEVCQTITRTKTNRKVVCNTLLWELEGQIKTFCIDFSRSVVFATVNDRTKMFGLSTGQQITDRPVWGDYSTASGKADTGIVDMKTRTDLNVELVDYVPYILDSGFNLSALDYDADTNSMNEREVYSGTGRPKTFCFISDNIIAVLVSNEIQIIDIKKQNDNLLKSLDMSEILPGQTVIAIDSIDSAYIIVITTSGLYRIKISSGQLVADGLVFTQEFRTVLKTPGGLVYKDNNVYTMSGGLHRINIVTSSAGTRTVSRPGQTIPSGPTSEIEDPPECGVAQIATRVTLIDGHTTSDGRVTTPVDTGNPNSPGTIDVGDATQPSIGGEQVEMVSPGEAGAFAIGVGDQKLEIVTRSSDGDINAYPYSFTNANPPVFTAGDAETPHSSISDIKAIFPASDDKYVVTGDGDVVLFSNGNKPDNLNHSDMPEQVDVAGIQEDVIIMISGTTLRLFSYAQNTISKLSQFILKSASGIRGVFRSRGYIFLVRSNQIEALHAFSGNPANVFNGNTTNKLSFSASAVAYHGTNIWYLDGGEIKRRPLRQTSRTTPGSVQVDLTTPSGETTILDCGGYNGGPTHTLTGNEGASEREIFKRTAPMFWSKLFKLDADWNPIGEALPHSGGLLALQRDGGGRYASINGRLKNGYNYYLSESIINRLQNFGIPATPEPETMFVDEGRVKLSPGRPYIGGQGHFPDAISTDGDHLYIVFAEGDVVAYNIKNKGYGYNRGKYQIDPIVGSKLSYCVPFLVYTNPGRFRVMYLYNLLAIRAGIAYAPTIASDYGKLRVYANSPHILGGFMGGVTAMTSLINGNIFYRLYGVSKAYNNETGWQSGTDAPTRARNSGRKTGRTLNNFACDGDPEGSLSLDRKPYIIFEFKDKRSLTRTHPAGDSKNNDVFDKDWNLTGGEGVKRTGEANILVNYRFGKATYAPTFREPNIPSSLSDIKFYRGVYSDYAVRQIISNKNYRADARYNYRLISSSRFPAGGKITCIFHDITTLYAIIQPPLSGKAKLYKIAFADIGTNGLDIKLSSTYETVNGQSRPKAKTAAQMEIGRWFEVRVDTTDYGDMVSKGEYDKMPDLQYFDSIDWDASNEMFVGTTAWSIYVFDRNFNFKVQKPLFPTRKPNTYENGYHSDLAPLEDKIHAKCIDTVSKKIFLLGRHFEAKPINHFWHFGDTRRTFSTNYLKPQDVQFGLRGVANVQYNGTDNIGGAYRYIYDNIRKRFVDQTKGGMSIPFVSTLDYNLTKTTIPPTRERGLTVGAEEAFDIDVAVVTVLPPTQDQLFNIISHDITKGIIHVLGEDLDGIRYCKALAININDITSEVTVERKTDKEVEVYPGEKPERVAALDGKVYMAVDDSPGDDKCKDLPDEANIGKTTKRPGQGPTSCVYNGASTYPLTKLCYAGNYNNQMLPDPCTGYEWAFDTSGSGIGIFRRVEELERSDITDTLIPVSRSGDVQRDRLPIGNRYLVNLNLQTYKICFYPLSFKRKPSDGPRLIPCPPLGHSLKLSQFCGGRKFNPECRVYVYSTANATGGREPTVTAYPRNHRVNVSQDVAEMASTGRILRGGARFADAISDRDSVCDLDEALKKKYVPPTPIQTEYTLEEVCEDAETIPPPPDGKQWYFVTPTDSDDEGTFQLLNEGLANNDNRVSVSQILSRSYTQMYLTGEVSSGNRYYPHRFKHICQMPDALKKGTGAGEDPPTQDEYSYSEICNDSTRLPRPDDGNHWYYVTSTTNNNYGKFTQMTRSLRNTDNRVLVLWGANTGIISGSSTGRYGSHGGQSICSLSEALKKGTGGTTRRRRTEYSLNEICSQDIPTAKFASRKEMVLCDC